jgi:peptidyl-prolyl cis-trans isomerase D
MFDSIRKHNKILQIILFLLIVPSFALFGIEGYSRMGEKGESVATVNGEAIYQNQWDQYHKQEVERVQQQSKNIDSKLLDSPEIRYVSLEKLVRDNLLQTAARKSLLLVSDQRVAKELQQDEFIRSLTKPDGKLDMERYRQVLREQGLTPEQYEARVRADIQRQQLLVGVGSTGITGQRAPDRAIQAYFQRRVIQLASFDPAKYQSKVSLSDAEVEAFYKSHLTEYRTTEQADIEYIVLDLDAIMKTVSVGEADLKAYYEQNTARWNANEERRASHILVTVTKTAPAEERKKALARAEAIRAAVAKAPESFAAVAKKESQDPGSAGSGGDLDFFRRGAMTKAFEDAVFAMKKGEISAPVETEFGYHIIKLTDIKGGQQRGFAELKGQIEAEVRKQLAQKKYAEMAEQFSNLVYEQADSLKPAADKLKLEIRTAQGVTSLPSATTQGALGQAKFLTALFSKDSLQSKRNTEAVEVAPSTLVSGRVLKYSPAAQLELKDVQDKVKARALAAKAAELARQDGAAKLQEIRTGTPGVTFGESVTVSRVERKQILPQVVLAALRADTGKLPSFSGVDLGDRGYAIVKVVQVVDETDPRLAQNPQTRNQYAQWWQVAEMQGYYETLKDRYKVQIKPAKPQAPSGSEKSQ